MKARSEKKQFAPMAAQIDGLVSLTLTAIVATFTS
jgi:hypothetical protein